MLSSLLLSFREGFEAVLIVGIILTYLSQTNKKRLSLFVYWGVFAGAVLSVVGGLLSFNEAQRLEESSKGIFEAYMMLIASGLIAYFVVWMSNQNRNISSSIKNNVDKNSTAVGLFLLTFLSVFREGVELITFLLAKVSENAVSVAAGTSIGIILAVALGIILFKTSAKLNIKIIFKILGIILIFLGADLFGEAATKLISTTLLPLEDICSVLFAGISLLYFLKDDFRRLLKR